VTAETRKVIASQLPMLSGILKSKIRLAYDLLREASAIGLQAAMNHTANSIADFEVAGLVLAALGDNAAVVSPDDGLRWGQLS
jgi:hypothetical protein